MLLYLRFDLLENSAFKLKQDKCANYWSCIYGDLLESIIIYTSEIGLGHQNTL